MGPTITTSGTALGYTEGNGSLVIDSNLTLTDGDSVNLEGATISITANFFSSEDRLVFTDQNGITGSYDTATGIQTLTGTATVANYQTALKSVRYRNISDNPSTAARTISFVATDGTTSSAAATRNVNITAVNDAPSISVTTTSTANYPAGSTAIAVDSAIAVTDLDNTTLASATFAIVSNFEAGDTLSFTDQNGITGNYNAGTGVLTLTGTASLLDYRNALRSVKFSTAANATQNTRSVTYQINDGVANSSTKTRNISVNAPNVAPVLTTTGTALAYTEGDGFVSVDTGLTLADADSTLLTGATAKISANYVSTEDTLSVVSQLGIAGTFNSTLGTMTLTGSANTANYQTVLRTVKYRNGSENPSNATRTITFTATDGLDTSTAATRSITVLPVNDIPVVTISAGAINYTEGSAATAIDSAMTIADADNTNLASMTVTISAGYANGEDVLAATTAGTNVTCNFTAASGVLSCTGSDTVANYQTVARNTTYINTSQAPSTANRTITYTVNDGTGDSLAKTRTVSVTAINNAPVVTSSAGILAYTENASAMVVDAGITIADADYSNMASATVSITTNFENGDVLAFTNQNGISGSYNASSGVLTLTGSASIANYQTSLRSITYHSTSDNPTANNRTISFIVNDGATNSNTAIRQITVTSVNDIPTITGTNSTVEYNSGAKIIDSGLILADLDNTTLANAKVAITGNFTAGQDVLSFTSPGGSGLTGVYNTGNGILTISGSASLANYQSALRAATYQNTATSPNTAERTIAFTANDGASDSAAFTRRLAIITKPAISQTTNTATYTEKEVGVAVFSNVSISVPSNTNLASATISISNNFVSQEDVLEFTTQNGITGSYNASTGVLVLNGSATLAHYKTAIESIKYRNSSKNPSSATRVLSIKINDGTSESDALTSNIGVIAVNDAPIIINPVSDITKIANQPFSVQFDVPSLVTDPDNNISDLKLNVTRQKEWGSENTDLPSGLSFNTTSQMLSGLLSSGDYPLSLTVTDPSNANVSSSFMLRVFTQVATATASTSRTDTTTAQAAGGAAGGGAGVGLGAILAYLGAAYFINKTSRAPYQVADAVRSILKLRHVDNFNKGMGRDYVNFINKLLIDLEREGIKFENLSSQEQQNFINSIANAISEKTSKINVRGRYFFNHETAVDTSELITGSSAVYEKIFETTKANLGDLIKNKSLDSTLENTNQSLESPSLGLPEEDNYGTVAEETMGESYDVENPENASVAGQSSSASLMPHNSDLSVTDQNSAASLISQDSDLSIAGQSSSSLLPHHGDNPDMDAMIELEDGWSPRR